MNCYINFYVTLYHSTAEFLIVYKVLINSSSVSSSAARQMTGLYQYLFSYVIISAVTTYKWICIAVLHINTLQMCIIFSIFGRSLQC